MKSEVAEAQWVPIDDLHNLEFAPTASKVIQKVIEHKGNLDSLSLSAVEYDVKGAKNVFYSNDNHFE
jgi:beta-galactosidase beta subunit